MMETSKRMDSGCRFLLWILFGCFFSCSKAFNVDIPTRIIHSSPQTGSWFGFSVALYKHDNINTVLVGAPKYNTSQPGVVRGGAVLRCSVEQSSQRCEYVPFDNRSHMRNDINFIVDNKNNQFFGATLKSRNGIVVACAPRYVWYTASRRRREPVGTCYVARRGMTDFQEFSPCRTEAWGYHRQGSCQAGFDAALTNGGDRMYIGAPGAFYWQGQIHSQSLIVKNEYFTTGEGPADEDDQYLGYSVATGHFTADDIQDVALGVPKGLNYTGKVVLFSHNLVWLQNITGDQLGSYFGYCLAVIDFNGDGFDDIVVGAPMHTDYANREMKIEVGKVHILLQDSAHVFRRQVTYLGTVDRGRFGLSVASLGDLNLDGFQDFAVGAPYGGEDGRGAVFLYHGFSTDGDVTSDALKAPVQVIYSAQVGGISTFGWSLAGGIDVDENDYPDLLVGAYEAEKAMLFKSRPIIKFLEHKLEFKYDGQRNIDIKNQNCEIKRGHFFSCIDIDFCMTYTGVNVDDNIELEVEFQLDKLQPEQRLLFASNEQGYYRENIKYVKEVKRCRTLKTFLKPGLEDKLTPISANVSYTLIENRRLPRSLTPVLDRGQTLSMGDALAIKNNCGDDKICVPNLVLSVDAPAEFPIGQKQMLNISIRVVNQEEDAFGTAVYITQPQGLLFNKYEPLENAACTVKKVEEKSVVKCDIGNPLPTNEEVFFHVLFQQSGHLEEPRFHFTIHVNSTNKEEEGTSADNVIRKTVEAKLEAQLTLFGSSEPESITYNTSLYRVPLRIHEDHVGPSLVHKYGILNSGPSDVKKAEIVILWPTKTLAGKYLLYLIEEPVAVGKIKCDRVPQINPLDLQKISAEERSSLLQLDNIGGSHRISSAQVDESGSYSSSSSSSSSSASSSSASSSSASSSSSSSSTKTKTGSSSSSVDISSSRREEKITSSASGGSSTTDGRGQGQRVSSSQGERREGYYHSSRGTGSSSGDGGSGSRGGIYSSGGGYEREGSYHYSSSSRGGSEGSYSSSGGQTVDSSSSARGGTDQRYSSGRRGGAGGSYTSSSGSRTEIDYSTSTLGGTEESYSSSGSRTGVDYSSSRHGGAERSYSYSAGDRVGGIYSSSSGGRTEVRGGTEGSYSSSAGGGAEGIYSSSGSRTKVDYPHSARGGAGGSYSYSRSESETRGASSRRGQSTDDRTDDGGYSPYGIEEREGPYSYSEGKERGHQDIHGSHSHLGGRVHSFSTETGRTAYTSGSGGQGSSSHDASSGRTRQGVLSSSSSSSGVQSGPILPSSGSGGRFSSTLFTVDTSGGGIIDEAARREEETSSSSSRTEDHHGRINYGSSSVEGQHLGGSRGVHTSSSQGGGTSYTSSSDGGRIGGGERGSGYSSSSSSRREYHYSSSSKGSGGHAHQFSSEDGTDGFDRSTGGGREEGKYYSSSYYDRNSPENSGSSSYSYRSSSSSYPPGDDFYRQNEINSRKKREISEEDEWSTMISECGSSLCTRIRCTTEELTVNDDVYIYIRSRLWVDTLDEEPQFQFPVDDVTITTRIIARAEPMTKELPADIDLPSDDEKVYSHNIVTPIRSVKSWEESPSIPWWVILLATLAGILILLLIILILWKLGFFKRKRGPN